MTLITNVLCPRWEFLLVHGDATLVVFKDLTKSLCFRNILIKYNETSFKNSMKGKIFYNAWLEVVYADSAILNAIYVFRLLHHNTVHTAHIIIYPVCDITCSALLASDWSHEP